MMGVRRPQINCENALRLILTLRLTTILMCEFKFTNHNDYGQQFLVHKSYGDLQRNRSNNEPGPFIHSVSSGNSIGQRIQSQSLTIHATDFSKSALQTQTPLYQLDNIRNPKKGKRRRKRWSRFDAISNRYQNGRKRSPLSKHELPADEKRNINIKINAPWPNRAHESEDNIWMKQLLPEIVKGYVKKYKSGTSNKAEVASTLNSVDDGLKNNVELDTEELVAEEPVVKKPKQRHRPEMRSATDCDEWDNKIRTCFFNRNIGDTITFILTFTNLEPDDRIDVKWQQEFYVRNANSTLLLDIYHDNTMWNVVIGSNNREFRISPLTETDFDFNGFIATAVIRYSNSEPHNPVITKIKFHIRQMAIDMGFVYPGEHLIINVKSFMTLPIECCSFEWYLDRSKSDKTLPSNMKVSDSGITVEISELRMEQEGILACNVFSNRNVFLTKKRFFIKEFQKDTLMRVFENHRIERATGQNGDTILSRVIRQIDDEVPNTYIAEVAPTEFSENLPSEMTFALNEGNEPAQNNTKDELNMPNNLSSDSVVASNQSNLVGETPKVGQQTNFSNSNEYVVEMGNVGVKSERIEIRMSKMLADCVSNRQCSIDATCHQENAHNKKFCRCRIGYRGNGLFCWEEEVGGHHQPSVYFVKNEKT